MTQSNIWSHREATGPNEINPVTGTATIEPGMFHEPDQEHEATRERSSGRFADKAQEMAGDAWSKMTAYLARYPVTAFLTALGAGFVLGRWGRRSVGFSHRLPRARADWRAN